MGRGDLTDRAWGLLEPSNGTKPSASPEAGSPPSPTSPRTVEHGRRVWSPRPDRRATPRSSNRWCAASAFRVPARRGPGRTRSLRMPRTPPARATCADAPSVTRSSTPPRLRDRPLVAPLNAARSGHTGRRGPCAARPADLDIAIPPALGVEDGEPPERYALRIGSGAGELTPTTREPRARLTRRQFVGCTCCAGGHRAADAPGGLVDRVGEVPDAGKRGSRCRRRRGTVARRCPGRASRGPLHGLRARERDAARSCRRGSVSSVAGWQGPVLGFQVSVRSQRRCAGGPTIALRGAGLLGRLGPSGFAAR